MRNIQKRIEKLERLSSTMRATGQSIRERATESCWTRDLEGLISSCGAEREGRPLSEREAAARKHYDYALEGECKWVGFRPPADFDRRPDVGVALIGTLVKNGYFDQYQRAATAYRQGLTPTEEEAAACLIVCSDWRRLLRLAGLNSNEELNQASDYLSKKVPQ